MRPLRAYLRERPRRYRQTGRGAFHVFVGASRMCDGAPQDARRALIDNLDISIDGTSIVGDTLFTLQGDRERALCVLKNVRAVCDVTCPDVASALGCLSRFRMNMLFQHGLLTFTAVVTACDCYRFATVTF